MAQIMLDRARILAVVGELIASRMAQHVPVDREVDTGLASWGGRPNGVILHGSGIGRNVEGGLAGACPRQAGEERRHPARLDSGTA